MTKYQHSLCYELLQIYNIYDNYKNHVMLSELKLLLAANNIENKIIVLDKFELIGGNVKFNVKINRK